jgi:hypothetical protein
MQQIADWLKKLGMSEYAQRFAENDIDFTILGDLTDQDLEKIGVVSLGHRRKLLRAIADIKTIQTSAHAAAVAAPAAPLTLQTAERRQVTVMFSDLVGSTALSQCQKLFKSPSISISGNLARPNGSTIARRWPHTSAWGSAQSARHGHQGIGMSSPAPSPA